MLKSILFHAVFYFTTTGCLNHDIKNKTNDLAHLNNATTYVCVGTTLSLSVCLCRWLKVLFSHSFKDPSALLSDKESDSVFQSPPDYNTTHSALPISTDGSIKCQMETVSPKCVCLKKHFKLRHHGHPGQLGMKVLAHKLLTEIKFKIIIIINQQAKSSSSVFPVKPKKLGLSQCLIYPFLIIAWQMSPFPKLILF